MYSESEYYELRERNKDIELERLDLSYSKGEKSHSRYYDLILEANQSFGEENHIEELCQMFWKWQLR